MGATTLTLFGLAAFASAVLAQQFPGDFPGNGNGNGFGNGNGGNGFGGGNFNNIVGFNIQEAMHTRRVHGILGTIAFVIVFPIGSIAMRIVPGRFSWFIHALVQMAGFVLYIAAAALGIKLTQEVRFGNTSLYEISTINFHPIIGLIILAIFFFQPLFGYLHHAQFKKYGVRQIWSYLHLMVGRLLIPLGIINGGLGLYISNSPKAFKIAYSILAVVFGIAWIFIAVISESRRSRQPAVVVVEQHKLVSRPRGLHGGSHRSSDSDPKI
ncbi:Putative cytochrome b561/ferric reductase transmembrane [Colletotrichum destructivum]|uniref:Cytochrome b561/ferric reductase transmembrane n=1 Tax=Colletotrichum destructivum TaxID=34406 RepID=A0AAX4IXS3_9PEZI|nr:Putative cytochrome b561/ferric reductase transmembrane [Colletotrichum destructivum]